MTPLALDTLPIPNRKCPEPSQVAPRNSEMPQNNLVICNEKA